MIRETLLTSTPARAFIAHYPKMMLILAGIGLFILTILRAANYPLTHDEAVSFSIFNGQPHWAYTANNHLLNTQLMKMAATQFGNSELALRLPNILAHGVYLTFSILFSLKSSKPAAQIGSFVLLNANLFMFDFFFLARGYGLGLGLQIASIYFLHEHTRQHSKDATLHYRNLYAAIIAAGLAVFANFTFLNYFIPLWVVSLGLLVLELLEQPENRRSRRQLLHWIVLSGGGIALIFSAAGYLLALQWAGNLFFGGTNNILSDTLKSLIEVSFYTVELSRLSIKIIAVGVLVMMGAFLLTALSLWQSKRKPSYFHWLLLISIGAIMLPILQNLLFDTRYPVERSALYYLPLFATLLSIQFDHLMSGFKQPRFNTLVMRLSLLISLTLTGYFVTNFNLSSCYSWGYDAYNKQVLHIVTNYQQQYFPNQPVSMSINWLFGPSFNYYRTTREYTWLHLLTRADIRSGEHEFIYAFETDLSGIPPGYAQIAHFPSINTVLLAKISD